MNFCDWCGETTTTRILAVRDVNEETTIIKNLCNKHYKESTKWLSFLSIDYRSPDNIEDVDDEDYWD